MIPEQRQAVLSLVPSGTLVYADFLTGQLISLKIDAIEAIEAQRANSTDTVWPGEHSYIYSRARQYHVRVSRATVIADIALAAAAAQHFIGSVVIAEHIEAPTVNAPTLTSGAWRTRTLNTLTDPDGIATLATNQLTLPAGTYDVFGGAAAYRVDGNQLRLQVLPADTTLLTGLNMRAANADTTIPPALIHGRITIAEGAILELQHRGAVTATAGMGLAVGVDFVENVYARIKFLKVA